MPPKKRQGIISFKPKGSGGSVAVKSEKPIRNINSRSTSKDEGSGVNVTKGSTGRTGANDLVDELSSDSEDEKHWSKSPTKIGVNQQQLDGINTLKTDSEISQMKIDELITSKTGPSLKRKRETYSSDPTNTSNTTSTSGTAASKLGSTNTKRVRFTKSFTKSAESEKLPNTEPLEIPDDLNTSQNLPWIIKYAPKTSLEVAIHAKKLNEIKAALVDMDTAGASITRLLYRPRLLIISGPTSSSKTSILTTLANELGYNNILEWHNHDRIENGGGIAESFEDFLSGAIFNGGSRPGSNSPGIFKKLILVEDIPNVSNYETKEMFNLALLQWINCPPIGNSLPPLVLIITEYEASEENRRYGGRGARVQPSYNTSSFSSSSSVSDSIIVERLISKNILNDPRVIRIKVPPVNFTLTTKILKRIVKEEWSLFSTLPVSKSEIEASVKSLATESGGDLRSAINSLEFWAKWQSSKSSKLKPISKEGNIDLFHAIGRIIHGSHKDSKGKPVLDDSVVVESVLKDWENNNRDGTFSLAIFENYPGAYNSKMTLESISSVADLLSRTDTLIPYDIPSIMSEICFRGVRYELRHASIDKSQTSQFRPLVYPRDRKSYFKRLELSTEYDDYRAQYSKEHGIMMNKTDSILYDGYYEPMINSLKRQGHQLRHPLLIKRVGGQVNSFSTIRAEQTEENDDDLEKKPYPITSKEPEPPDFCMTLSDDDIDDSDDDV